MGFFGFLKSKPKEKKVSFAGKYKPSGDFLLDFNTMGSMIELNKDWVYICSHKNSLNIMKYPLKLYVARESQDNPYNVPQKCLTLADKLSLEAVYGQRFTKSFFVDEVTSHRFLDLINEPNSYTTYEEMIYLLNMGLELDGNSYLYIVRDGLGKPYELHVIPPQYMYIGKKSKNSDKIVYIYNDGYNKYRIQSKNIIHIKFPTYRDMNKGSPPISHLAEIYEIHINMNRFENAVFKNMGELSGIFTTEQELSTNEFKRIKKEIETNFYGTKNAGKAPLLTSGLNYTNVSNSPREMSYHEGRKMVRDMIASAYDIHIAMLTSDNVNKANAEAAYKAYARDAILPRMKLISAKINKICKELDPKLFCAFENPDKEDKQILLEKQVKFVEKGVWTRNEVRGQEGDMPLTGLDDPLTPINTQPLSAWTEQSGGTDE